MLKILTVLDKALQAVYDHIMMITGAAVTLLILVGAFMRYVLKIDFRGSEEIVLMFGYWLYFIGSIAAARNCSHLNANMVTVFTSNQRVIQICNLIRDVLALAICLLAIKWCWQYWSWTWGLKPVTSVRKIPYFIQQFPMCLSFLMWGIYLFRDCIRSVVTVKNRTAQEGGSRV